MTDLPRLIGLGGRKRSGKDTLAEHWRDTQGYVVMGMSEPLLAMALVLDPWIPIEPVRNLLGQTFYALRLSTLVEKDGYTKAKEHTEVREFLKRLGTDVGREMIDQDLWVKQAEKAIRAHWEAGKNVALTGIRFPNELAMVKRLEGHLVWVNRPSVADGDTHASETSVSEEDFNFTLENTSTLERLYAGGDFLLGQMETHRKMGAMPTEYVGITQDARALLDEHGYIVAKPAVNQVTFYDGMVYVACNDYESELITEMERITSEQDFSWEGRILSTRQRSAIERAKKQGREYQITNTSVSVGDFTEDTLAKHARLVGRAEAQGWLAEVQGDGSVITRHPIDWMAHTDFPKGYGPLTKDPHEPLECDLCGARYVNHLQHTKWHASNDSK